VCASTIVSYIVSCVLQLVEAVELARLQLQVCIVLLRCSSLALQVSLGNVDWIMVCIVLSLLECGVHCGVCCSVLAVLCEYSALRNDE
jgi:hypothetical protein